MMPKDGSLCMSMVFHDIFIIDGGRRLAPFSANERIICLNIIQYSMVSGYVFDIAVKLYVYYFNIFLLYV